MNPGRATRTELALVFAYVAEVWGFALNALAFRLYGGMPVYFPDLPNGLPLDSRHVVGFSVIGDYIPAPGYLLSPGDVLLYGGLLAVAALSIAYVVSGQAGRRWNRKRGPVHAR